MYYTFFLAILQGIVPHMQQQPLHAQNPSHNKANEQILYAVIHTWLTKRAVQMLRVFFPETSEVERRQLAMAVPMSTCPCPGLYDSLELEKLCSTFDTYVPSHVDEKRGVYHKRTWESVRQLVGALGLGDHMDEEKRNASFDQLDMDADGLVRVHISYRCQCTAMIITYHHI